jgi:hypothetical protein
MLEELRKPSNELLAFWADNDREGELEAIGAEESEPLVAA